MSDLDDLPESERVKRWHASGDYAYPAEEKDDGEFVEYEDYMRLSSRVKELELENGELRKLRDGVRVSIPTTTMEAEFANRARPFKDRAERAEAELAALKEKIAGQTVLMEEVRGYLDAASEGSMSRNNSEQLASELLDQINALLDMGKEG